MWYTKPRYCTLANALVYDLAVRKFEAKLRSKDRPLSKKRRRSYQADGSDKKRQKHSNEDREASPTSTELAQAAANLHQAQQAHKNVVAELKAAEKAAAKRALWEERTAKAKKSIESQIAALDAADMSVVGHLDLQPSSDATTKKQPPRKKQPTRKKAAVVRVTPGARLGAQ